MSYTTQWVRPNILYNNWSTVICSHNAIAYTFIISITHYRSGELLNTLRCILATLCCLYSIRPAKHPYFGGTAPPNRFCAAAEWFVPPLFPCDFLYQYFCFTIHINIINYRCVLCFIFQMCQNLKSWTVCGASMKTVNTYNRLRLWNK